MLLLVASLLFICVAGVGTMKVLLIAPPFFSVGDVFAELAVELRHRGHEVSFLYSTSLKRTPDEKLHAAGVEILRFDAPKQETTSLSVASWLSSFASIVNDEVLGANYMALIDSNFAISECRALLSDRELFVRLRAARFDFVLFENVGAFRCFVLVPQLLGDVKFAAADCFAEPWLMGASATPSAFPTPCTALSFCTLLCAIMIK